MIAMGIDARGYSVQFLPISSREGSGPLLVAHVTVTAFHPYVSLAQPINHPFSQIILMMPVEVVGIRRVPPSTVDPSVGGALLERSRHFRAFDRGGIGISR